MDAVRQRMGLKPTAAPQPSPAELDEAARKVQKLWKRRKARIAFAMLTSKETINRLKALFLDDRAKKAGAESNPLYSLQAMSARDALRRDPIVVAALSDSWLTVTAAAGARGQPLFYNDYKEMARKLYLACCAATQSADISPSEFQEGLAEDWDSDSAGTGACSEQAFCRSWFELADVHVDAIDAEQYAEWLRHITRQIVTLERADPYDEESMAEPKWRLDAQLLNDVRSNAQLNAKKFAARRSKWVAAFPDETRPPIDLLADTVPAPAPEAPAEEEEEEAIAETPHRSRRSSLDAIVTGNRTLKFGETRGWCETLSKIVEPSANSPRSKRKSMFAASGGGGDSLFATLAPGSAACCAAAGSSSSSIPAFILPVASANAAEAAIPKSAAPVAVGVNSSTCAVPEPPAYPSARPTSSRLQAPIVMKNVEQPFELPDEILHKPSRPRAHKPLGHPPDPRDQLPPPPPLPPAAPMPAFGVPSSATSSCDRIQPPSHAGDVSLTSSKFGGGGRPLDVSLTSSAASHHHQHHGGQARTPRLALPQYSHDDDAAYEQAAAHALAPAPAPPHALAPAAAAMRPPSPVAAAVADMAMGMAPAMAPAMAPLWPCGAPTDGSRPGSEAGTQRVIPPPPPPNSGFPSRNHTPGAGTFRTKRAPRQPPMPPVPHSPSPPPTAGAAMQASAMGVVGGGGARLVQSARTGGTAGGGGGGGGGAAGGRGPVPPGDPSATGAVASLHARGAKCASARGPRHRSVRSSHTHGLLPHTSITAPQGYSSIHPPPSLTSRRASQPWVVGRHYIEHHDYDNEPPPATARPEASRTWEGLPAKNTIPRPATSAAWSPPMRRPPQSMPVRPPLMPISDAYGGHDIAPLPPPLPPPPPMADPTVSEVELSAMMEIARRVAVHKSAALTIKNSQKTFLVTNHLSASLLLRPKTSQ